MTKRDRPGAAAATQLLVRFLDNAAANRRVAGVSAAGRWLAVAREAGFHDVAFATSDGGDWLPATRADFGHVSGTADVPPLNAAASTASHLREIDGRFLPSPERLAHGNRASSEAIDLDQPDAMRRIIQATAKGSDGIVSRWLNRPVSQRISLALLTIAPGIRPAQVTLIVAAVAVAMVLTLLTGGAAGLVWGSVLFHVASILDGVDGEIARATFRSSPAGAALDTRVDMLTNIGFFVAVSVALTRLYGGAQATVGGLAVLFALIGLGTTAWLLKKIDRPGSFDVVKLYYRERFPNGWQWLVTETLVSMTSRDFFAFAFAVVIVLGFGWAMLWLLLAFTATYLVFVLCAVPGVLRSAEMSPVKGISA